MFRGTFTIEEGKVVEAKAEISKPKPKVDRKKAIELAFIIFMVAQIVLVPLDNSILTGSDPCNMKYFCLAGVNILAMIGCWGFSYLLHEE